MNHLPLIKCPTCGQQNTWNPKNSFKPFCSDRCKLIDLGEWASETRKIPSEQMNEVEENLIQQDDFDY